MIKSKNQNVGINLEKWLSGKKKIRKKLVALVS